MYSRIGKWAEAAKEIPPYDVDDKQSVIVQVRNECKKIKIGEGDKCFVCGAGIKEVLRKHHLVLVAAYANYGNDLNEHIAVLCENHHHLAHCLIYGERGGLTWQSVQKLKDAGYWEAFCELDRMAAKALKVLDERYKNKNTQMRLAI